MGTVAIFDYHKQFFLQKCTMKYGIFVLLAIATVSANVRAIDKPFALNTLTSTLKLIAISTFWFTSSEEVDALLQFNGKDNEKIFTNQHCPANECFNMISQVCTTICETYELEDN